MATTLTFEKQTDGDTWIECTLCGAGSHLSRIETIGKTAGCFKHKSKLCGSKAELVAPLLAAPAQTAPQVDAVTAELESLKTFGRNVARTGFTKGRDQDVLDAVRGGYLSMDAAMNTDD